MMDHLPPVGSRVRYRLPGDPGGAYSRVGYVRRAAGEHAEIPADGRKHAPVPIRGYIDEIACYWVQHVNIERESK